eukprot:1931934-Heterocapsa_arctica.AAC.1
MTYILASWMAPALMLSATKVSYMAPQMRARLTGALKRFSSLERLPTVMKTSLMSLSLRSFRAKRTC